MLSNFFIRIEEHQQKFTSKPNVKLVMLRNSTFTSSQQDPTEENISSTN